MQQRFGRTWHVRTGIGSFLVLTHLLAGAVAVGVVSQRLKDGQPIAEIPPAPRWPLTKLISLLDALGARERQYGALRQQMLTHTEQAAVQEERNRLARPPRLDQAAVVQHQRAGGGGTSPLGSRSQSRARCDADVRRSAHEAMVEMRALLQQLRPAPLETVGLVEALRDQCEALGYRSGARVTTHFGALPPDDQLPPGAQDAIFRIAQEALGNVARHARADHVALHLDQHHEALLLQVRDDGQGFDPQRAGGGMGLGNMRERVQLVGGSITVESAPGDGTLLSVHVPLVQPLVQEASMSAETKALVQRGIWLLAGVGIVHGASYVVMAAMGRYFGGGIGQPVWFGCMAILLLFLVVGLLCRRSAHRIQQRIALNIGASSAPSQRLSATWHAAQYGSLAVGAFVLPFIWLHYPNWIYYPVGAIVGFPFWNDIQPIPISKNEQWIAVGQAGFWAALAVFELVRFLHADARYRASLPAHELRLLLEKEGQQLRLSTFVFLLLVPLQIYNNMNASVVAFGEAVFPPQTAAHWMATLSWMLPFMLIASVAVQWWRYRQARHLLNREVRV